jgi:hypothetical protein
VQKPYEMNNLGINGVINKVIHTLQTTYPQNVDKKRENVDKCGNFSKKDVDKLWKQKFLINQS